MRPPQLTADNGAAHVKDGTGKTRMELFVNCQKINLYEQSAEQLLYSFGLTPEIIRKGSFSKTITLDPLSPTFIEDYYTFTHK